MLQLPGVLQKPSDCNTSYFFQDLLASSSQRRTKEGPRSSQRCIADVGSLAYIEGHQSHSVGLYGPKVVSHKVSMASVASNDTLEPAAAAKATINKTGPLRIILLVEATAAAASGWSNIRKWLDVILQKVEIEVNAAADASQPERQQEPNSTMPGIQYSLIVYGTRDRSTQAPVQCSAWTSKRTQLAAWLDGIQFVGGVSSKGTALPQALAEAIVMSKSPYPGGAKPAPAGKSKYTSCVLLIPVDNSQPGLRRQPTDSVRRNWQSICQPAVFNQVSCKTFCQHYCVLLLDSCCVTCKHSCSRSKQQTTCRIVACLHSVCAACSCCTSCQPSSSSLIERGSTCPHTRGRLLPSPQPLPPAHPLAMCC